MATPAKKSRAHDLLVSGGDAWAWCIDRFHARISDGLPNANSVVGIWPDQKGHGPFGELMSDCAQDVTRGWSAAYFETIKRRKNGEQARLPLRKRWVVPVTWRKGRFDLSPWLMASAPGCGSVPLVVTRTWSWPCQSTTPMTPNWSEPCGLQRRPGSCSWTSPPGWRWPGLKRFQRRWPGSTPASSTPWPSPPLLTCNKAHHRDVAGAQNMVTKLSHAPLDIARTEHRRVGSPARRDRRRHLFDADRGLARTRAAAPLSSGCGVARCSQGSVGLA
jgi:hypothetical protein